MAVVREIRLAVAWVDPHYPMKDAIVSPVATDHTVLLIRQGEDDGARREHHDDRRRDE